MKAATAGKGEDGQSDGPSAAMTLFAIVSRSSVSMMTERGALLPVSEPESILVEVVRWHSITSRAF